MMNNELFNLVEDLLYRFDSIKEEISYIKELEGKDNLTPVEKAFLSSVGVSVKRDRTREELDYIIGWMNGENIINNPYQVPCEFNVLNAEFCLCMNVHMSKCPYVRDDETECLMYSPSIPKESFDEERFSQYWLNNFPEIVNEIESYLKKGEMPDSKLFRIVMGARDGYETGDILKYFQEVKKKFKQPPKRKPMSPKLRFKILNRDGFKCKYCGRTAENGIVLHVDHIIPVAKGGTDDESNLVTSCQDCNLGKSDTEL